MMEYYGNTVIAILVAAVVVMGLGQFPSSVGALLMRAVELPDTGEEGEAYHAFMNVPVPGVILTNPYACVVGVMTPLEEFLQIEAIETTKPELLRILKEDYTAASGQISIDRDAVRFDSPGIYNLELRVTAQNGRSRILMVKILVNEEAFS